MVADLNEIAAFAQVVRSQSFTRAAASLGLPKSTLSERVARLEERLGVRLLERTTRSLRPTPAGSAYYERVAHVVDDLEEASTEVAESHGAPRGLVRVGSSQLAARVFLLSVIDKFARRWPEVDIDVVTADRRFSLVEEGLDLAVQVFAPAENVVVRPLATAARVCVASPEYLAEHGTPHTPEDLRVHRCIITATTATRLRQATWTFSRDAREHAVTVRGRYVVSSIELATQAALDGVGIALAPTLTCAEEIARGRLVHLLDRYTAGSTELLLVHPSTRGLPHRVRLLVDHIVESFRDAPALPGMTKLPGVAPEPSGRAGQRRRKGP